MNTDLSVIDADFLAYEYCERNRINLRPGQTPPARAYIAIGAPDHPVVAEYAEKARRRIRALYDYALARIDEALECDRRGDYAEAERLRKLARDAEADAEEIEQSLPRGTRGRPRSPKLSS